MTRLAFISLLLLGCEGSLPGDPHARMCLVAFDSERADIVLDAANEWSERTGKLA